MDGTVIIITVTDAGGELPVGVAVALVVLTFLVCLVVIGSIVADDLGVADRLRDARRHWREHRIRSAERRRQR